MQKLIILIGADNTGKSTIIENTIMDIERQRLLHRYFHFSGPKPGEHIMERYVRALNQIKDDYVTDYFIFDRGYYETAYYERQRRGATSAMVDEIIKEEKSIEQRFIDHFGAINIEVYVNYKPAYWTIPHHQQEINANFHKWDESTSLEGRLAEHEQYYSYMRQHHSLLPKQLLEVYEKDYSLLSKQIIAV